MVKIANLVLEPAPAALATQTVGLVSLDTAYRPANAPLAQLGPG